MPSVARPSVARKRADRAAAGFSPGPAGVVEESHAYILLGPVHKMEVNLTHCTPGTLGIYLLPSLLFPFVASLFWRTVRWYRNVWKFPRTRCLAS